MGICRSLCLLPSKWLQPMESARREEAGELLPLSLCHRLLPQITPAAAAAAAAAAAKSL